MPAPGDQHKPNGSATHNPFEEPKPRISEYTAQEIATLQSRLNQRLGPEYISTRAGPGNSRVAYLSAEKAINLANEIFGFNGWSSSIQNIQIDFVDENATKGTISIGLSVVVRVTLRDGTYHEDTGYGGIENCKSKIAAFEKAKKEGTTDALKRAFRNFGNVLGNCIYDKDYITKVSKIKVGAGRWDVDDLHRHADFLPKKEEEMSKPVVMPVSNISTLQQQGQPPPLLPEESFDVNDFNDADFDDLGHPDEVVLPPDTGPQQKAGPQQPQQRPPLHQQMTPSKPPQYRPDQQHPNAQAQQNDTLNARQPPHLRQNGKAPTPHDPTVPLSRSSSPGIPSQHFSAAPQQPPAGQSLGFFSAKVADALDANNNPVGGTAAAKFNPYAESPSIRKTSGVDHSKSLALNKHTLREEPLVPLDEKQPKQSASRPVQRPAAGPAGGAMSPAGRGMTSAYRPPTRHGPVSTNAVPTVNGTAGGEKILTAAKRAPLGDLSNVQHGANAGATTDGGGDTKRQRIGPGLSGNTENVGNAALPG